MEPGLTLVGVVHRDPAGEARLLALLRRLAPQAIGLELAEPSIRARLERGPELAARLASSLRAAGRADLADELAAGGRPGGVVGELAGALELPFELRAARAFAAQGGAAIELLDDPAAAAAAVARLLELFEPDNVRSLLAAQAREPAPPPDPVAEQYALARRYQADPRLFRYHFGAEEAAALEARDAYAAAGLERLAARFERVVYVAGWEHLIDGGLATIGPRFKERARLLLLCDAPEAKEGRPDG